MVKPLLWTLTGLLSVVPAAAQYVDEEELDDHRQQDERYYERYADKADEAAPPGDEAELVRAFLARADELIRDKNYRSDRTPDLFVQTDDPRLDLRATVRLLDDFRSFFESFWSGHVELQPYEDPSHVFLFYSYYKYNQLLDGDWRRSYIRPKGHYGNLFDALVVHMDSDRPGGLANTLVHEAAHQLIDRRIYGAGNQAPLWVSEGLATYFGETHMGPEGRFERGIVGGKKVALLRGESSKGSSSAPGRLRQLKRALRATREEEGSIVGRVVGARDPNQFYGGDVLGHYAVSWLLVHFLLHADGGAHAESLYRYLALEVSGKGGSKVFYDTVGLGADELDLALLGHLETIKVR